MLDIYIFGHTGETQRVMQRTERWDCKVSFLALLLLSSRVFVKSVNLSGLTDVVGFGLTLSHAYTLINTLIF